jgi:serine O-acetyltransferase
LSFVSTSYDWNARQRCSKKIEGHVDIGAGAKILGAVTVGRHAKIGANAVVLRDVPAGATAIGVPAKITLE